MVRRKRCDNCKELFHPAMLLEVEGYHYCESCASKLATECEECHTLILNGNIHVCDGVSFCRRCLSINTFRCSWCGERHVTLDEHEDDHGVTICDSCYNDSVSCTNCGRYVHVDDAIRYDGNIYCEDCVPDEDEEDGGDLPEHDHMPRLKFYGDTIAHNNIGIEFEIDDGNSRETCWQTLETEIEGIWCKQDGSLSHGIEICTHPMSVEYFLNTFQLKEMIAICTRYGFKSDETSTCGMHIHIDRRWFGEGQEREDNITKMCLLLDMFWDNFKTFTRRTDSTLQRWARRYGLETDDPWFIVDNCTVGQKVKSMSVNNRYQCLNLQNRDTVEWRMPKGSLNYNTIRATVQMVSVLVILSKRPIKDLHNFTWKKMIETCMEMYP